jgi:hypothetical protein
LEVSQDAEDRYQAYCETLAHYGLSLDPDLIFLGNFRRNSGITAIQQLVDNRRVSFDALVSANDNMAIGAMQALQERGIRIPEDVVVAGFDDIEETRAVVPALTTVRTPWHMLGSKSVDLLLSKMAGEPLPEQILLQTELVYRRSCGCQPTTFIELPGSSPHDSNKPFEIVSPARTFPPPVQTDLLRNIKKSILSEIAEIPGLDSGWSTTLISAFLADARSNESKPTLFIQMFVGILSQISSGTQIIEWQEVLDAIRSKVKLLFQSEHEIIQAHELLENGYAAIAEMAHRRQLSQRLEQEDQTDRLNRIVQAHHAQIEGAQRSAKFALPRQPTIPPAPGKAKTQCHSILCSISWFQ